MVQAESAAVALETKLISTEVSCCRKLSQVYMYYSTDFVQLSRQIQARKFDIPYGSFILWICLKNRGLLRCLKLPILDQYLHALK